MSPRAAPRSRPLGRRRGSASAWRCRWSLGGACVARDAGRRAAGAGRASRWSSCSARPRRPLGAERRRRRAIEAVGRAAPADPGAAPSCRSSAEAAATRVLAAGAAARAAQRARGLDRRRGGPGATVDRVAHRRLALGPPGHRLPRRSGRCAASARSSASPRRRRPRGRSSSRRRWRSPPTKPAARSRWPPAPARNALQEFEGGPGQIALHGTDNLTGRARDAPSRTAASAWARAPSPGWRRRIGAGVPVTVTR